MKNDEAIRWMFIETISQMDVDNLTLKDMQRTVANCTYISFDGYSEEELKVLWDDAAQCVACP